MIAPYSLYLISCDKVLTVFVGFSVLTYFEDDDVDEYDDVDDEEEVPRQGTKATSGLCLYVLAELNFLPPELCDDDDYEDDSLPCYLYCCDVLLVINYMLHLT